jgi:Family of unknown function (DUF5941)
MSPKLSAYRDDGPLARLLGAVAGGAVALPPAVLVAAGAVPLFIVIAVDGDHASTLVAGVTVAWAVVTAGVSSGRPHTDRFAWAVPALLRLVEYGTLLWIAAIFGGAAPPAAFALLAVVALRRYDAVYRLRLQGVPPPRRVDDLAGGWDGRMIAGWVLLAVGAVPAGFYAIAAFAALLFVSESVISWRAPAGAKGDE